MKQYENNTLKLRRKYIMYHSVWKKSHYQAGLRYGSMFTVNPLSHFERSAEKTAFTQKCIPLYQKY